MIMQGKVERQGNKSMNENSRRMILFRIIVNQENGGFSHASNFITKIVNGEEVTAEDVKGISNRILPVDGSFMWKARDRKSVV